MILMAFLSSPRPEMAAVAGIANYLTMAVLDVASTTSTDTTAPLITDQCVMNILKKALFISEGQVRNFRCRTTEAAYVKGQERCAQGRI